jgi:hypothetical protein
MIQKTTPRYKNETLNCMNWWKHYKPYVRELSTRPEYAAEYVVIAAMIHCPCWSTYVTSSLEPADFLTEFTQRVSRICISELNHYGLVDGSLLVRRLESTCEYSPRALEVYFETFNMITSVIVNEFVLQGAILELKS